MIGSEKKSAKGANNDGDAVEPISNVSSVCDVNSSASSQEQNFQSQSTVVSKQDNFATQGTVTNSDVGQFSNGRTFGNLADGQYAVQSDNHGNSNMITDFQQHYLMPGGKSNQEMGSVPPQPAREGGVTGLLGAQHIGTTGLVPIDQFAPIPPQQPQHQQQVFPSSQQTQSNTLIGNSGGGAVNTITSAGMPQGQPLLGAQGQHIAQQAHMLSSGMTMQANSQLLPATQQHWMPMGQQPLMAVGGNGQFQLQNMNMHQAAPPQQQQSAHQSSHSVLVPPFGGTKFPAKAWHSGDHGLVRGAMVEEIIKLLKTRRPNATDDWHEKLPHMAKRLEDALYHEAPHLADYSDNTTLKYRLQQLALSMGGNTGVGGGGGKNQHSGVNGGSGGGNSKSNGGDARHSRQQQQPTAYLSQQQQQQQQQASQGQYAHQQQLQAPSLQPQQYSSAQVQQMQYQQQYMQQQYPQQQHYQHQYQQQAPSRNSGSHQQPYLSHNQAAPSQLNSASGSALLQHPPQQGSMVYNAGAPLLLDATGAGSTSSVAGNSLIPAEYMAQQGTGGSQQQQPGRLHYPQQQQHPVNAGAAMHGQPQQQMMLGGPGVQSHLGQQQHSYSLQQQQQQQQQLSPEDQLLQQSMAGGYMGGSRTSAQSQQQQQPPPHSGKQMGQSGSGQAPSGGGHSDEHRRQVLKQQQQRLLLLRHASKCPHDNGQCPVTPHCWSMKVLWKHIMSCKDQECKVPHCVSSRYVLSHYSKCKEQSCPVCGPVREAIKRNYERSRDVVKMARAPGQYPQQGSATQYSVGQAQQHHNVPGRDDSQPPAAKKAKMDRRSKSDSTNQVLTIPHAAQNQQKLVIPARPPKSVYPLDPISCAIYSFTDAQIASHFKNIQEGMKLTAAKIKEMCRPILDEVLRIPHAYGVFGTPVDPVALNLPDYNDVIKYPMDLGTVMRRLEGGSYRDLDNFVFDVHLTFDNAMVYNPKNSDVYLLAKSLKKEFDGRYRLKVAEFEKSIEDSRGSPDSCLICGEVSLKFEPPVYYCNGTCAQRIRRNAVFYSNSTNTYHWCSACFNSMRENETVRLPDCTISRAELLRGKKKHSEDSEEGWVQCEGVCKRWVHQVCALFNARRNTSDEVSYVCPLCIQDHRRKHPDQLVVAPTTKKMRAADLPESTMSQFLEKRVHQRLEMAYFENADKLGVSVCDVEKCPPLILRQVSCLDKMHTVREGVFGRYKDKGYPADFPCRTKCVVLFQNIDGQDVILFGMYVYEYGHKCPQPNQRRVYISYLDSVHYLRPRQYRTMVYHEILISYLDYVRARGFHTAHIWACPPQKGDDYILYVHPSDQKTPKPQILRVWYDEMLKLCKERGIVCEVNDLHSEYLLDPTLDATVLPYFEGDYWVNEAEVIIRDLGAKGSRGKNAAALIEDEEDDVDSGEGPGKKSKRKTKAKQRPTRTSSKPLASGRYPDRDPVMAKLASIIEPMKDTFFVARLHPKEYAERFAEQRRVEVMAEASENTTESNDLRQKQLQEEALQGNDVNMPAIPPAPPVKEEDSSTSSGGGEESEGKQQQQQQSGQSPFDNDEDEDDDFGRAASSISRNNDDGGIGTEDRRLEGTPSPDMDQQVTSGQQNQAESSESLNAADREPDAEMEVDEGAAVGSSSNKRKLQSLATDAVDEAILPQQVATPGSTRNSRSGRARNYQAIAADDGEAVDEQNTSSIAAGEPASSSALSVNCAVSAGGQAESKADEIETTVTVLEPAVPTNIAEPTDNFVANKHFQAETLVHHHSQQRDNSDGGEPVAKVVKMEDGLEKGDVNADGNAEIKPLKDEEADRATPSSERLLIPCGDGLPPQLSDDTEDVDDVQESEHFDTRQSFLNLCQGNHYQFDQLRRAKHTSMMVLYHLHTPDAPKFVPSCNQCHADILAGYRYHCESCEIDFCHTCFSATGQRIHQHPLRPINMSSSAPTQLTEEQRKERQRSIQLHMQLLGHAANCVKCDSKNCHRMKEFLRHDSTCTIKVGGGCRLCARISNLLNIHARSCRVDGCKVPHCIDLREQIRKLTMRQQQMDDRRRQKMNIEYNRGGGSSSSSATAGTSEE